MDKNQKLALIARYERRRKLKRVLSLSLIVLALGVLMIYFQVMNYEDIQ